MWEINHLSTCFLFLQVFELGPDAVLLEIESLIVSVATSVMSGRALSYTVPNRSSSNQHYVPELDRIVLKGKVSDRSFLSVSSVRKVSGQSHSVSLYTVYPSRAGAGRDHNQGPPNRPRNPAEANPHHQARLVLL